jgi:hypothetical protein
VGEATHAKFVGNFLAVTIPDQCNMGHEQSSLEAKKIKVVESHPHNRTRD